MSHVPVIGRWILKLLGFTGILVLALLTMLPVRALALSPDSPEVKRVVERAVKWLESQEDTRLGGKCLIGLACYKAGRGLDHPKVQAALKACQGQLPGQSEVDYNYSVGLALIFLLETDPTRNRSLAQRYVTEILKHQQSGGGWGYSGNTQGDTSQTQYPTLGLWLAYSNGLDVPQPAFEKACGWLLRTQDPTGGWGYQGEDPGNFQRVNQSDVKPALAAAGLGSVYICADLLATPDSKSSAEATGLPVALRPVEEVKAKRRTSAIDPKIIRRAMDDGNQWFAKNYTLESPGYTHYYLYAFERYHSFRELWERKADPNPKWYNDVVAMLQKSQQSDGHWEGADTAVIATSFAVLTLVRSAKKTITKLVGELGDGVLLGGLGLPPNTADLQERDGKLLEKPLAGTLDELLRLLEKADESELVQLAESTAAVPLDENVTKRSGQIAKLREIVSAGAYEQRLIAVKNLGRSRDFDSVPLLIYALTDPDPQIVRAADRGLRFISRKLEGVGMPAEPKPADVKAAITAWKAWYQTVRPQAEFLD